MQEPGLLNSSISYNFTEPVIRLSALTNESGNPCVGYSSYSYMVLALVAVASMLLGAYLES